MTLTAERRAEIEDVVNGNALWGDIGPRVIKSMMEDMLTEIDRRESIVALAIDVLAGRATMRSAETRTAYDTGYSRSENAIAELAKVIPVACYRATTPRANEREDE